MKLKKQDRLKKKIRVAILFGGKSAEHEVSLQSAKNVFDSIDKGKYDVSLIGISKKGKWLLPSGGQGSRLRQGYGGQARIKGQAWPLLGDGSKSKIEALAPKLAVSDHPVVPQGVDVVFPVLHGPFGEDGTVQGLLKLAGVPFVGAGVLGSAVGMDKDVMKRLLRDAGIPIAKFISIAKFGDVPPYDFVVKTLGVPFFVKPANLGSSVGVSKVKNKVQYKKALGEAFSYDTKVLVEEYVRGRELECSVLGNDKPVASVPGEVIPHHEFYSYEAKYIDENGAALVIPANVTPAVVKEVRSIATTAFKVLCCEGMARADFFLRHDGKLFLNEINTIPGFTKISMYPKLWEATGVSYTKLIDTLIELALERHEREKKLKTTYES